MSDGCETPAQVVAIDLEDNASAISRLQRRRDDLIREKETLRRRFYDAVLDIDLALADTNDQLSARFSEHAELRALHRAITSADRTRKEPTWTADRLTPR